MSRLHNPNNQAVAKHPRFDEGQKNAEENELKHKQLTKELKPRGIKGAELRVWNRVAFELSKAGRLKAIYVDIILQYCVVKSRLDELRKDLDNDKWFYETIGRHGVQYKSRPEVAQLNDDFRKFMQLTAHLGLSPATEMRFNSAQGDLFSSDFDEL